MNYNEFKAAEKQLEDELAKFTSDIKSRRAALCREFATAHNDVNIGDVLSDGLTIIVVDKILYTTGVKPQCAYKGRKLTAKLKLRKDGAICTVYQNNIKERLGALEQ